MTSDQLTAKEKVILSQFRKTRLQQRLKHKLHMAPKYSETARMLKAAQVK